MLGSSMLEVGIGLIFSFLVFSLILSAVAEMIETRLKLRAVDLQRALAELLDGAKGGDNELRKKLLSHGMLYGLFRGDPKVPTLDELKHFQTGKNLPSYVPKASFAQALIDVLQTDSALAPPKVQDALNAMKRVAGSDTAHLQAEIERWYDSTMERASGWYKRRTHRFLFWTGLVVAILLNINAVSIARHLEASPQAREAVVAASSQVLEQGRAQLVQNEPKQDPGIVAIQAQLDTLKAASIPIGWGSPIALTDACRRHNGFARFVCERVELAPVSLGQASAAAGGWLLLLAGWFAMAAAATLGAPFWFDVLGKFMQVRGSRKPAEGKTDTASPTARNTHLILEEPGK